MLDHGSAGYFCLLGDEDVDCPYGRVCFKSNGTQFYNWPLKGSADLNNDKCYYGNFLLVRDV